MRLSTTLAVAALAAVSSLSPTHAPAPAHAQDAKLEVRGADTVGTVLGRQVGKRVSVVLTTGPELAGVVVSVGDKVVHLSDLTGREFFDAVVSLEQIGAVTVRVRPR